MDGHLLEKVVLAVENERDGVVPRYPTTITTVQGGDEMGSFDGGVERVRSTVWFISGVPQQEVIERFDMVDLVRDRAGVLVCAEQGMRFFFVWEVMQENVPAHVVHQIKTCFCHSAVYTIQSRLICCSAWNRMNLDSFINRKKGRKQQRTTVNLKIMSASANIDEQTNTI